MCLVQTQIVDLLRSRELVIRPMTRHHLQSAGVQLSLGTKLAKLRPGQVIDPRSEKPLEWDTFEIDESTGYILEPGAFVLGHTHEAVQVPDTLLAQLDGRSTLGRCGLVPHKAAMFIWPGHGGGENGPRQITLEIKNHGEAAIILWPRLFIANMVFHRLEEAAAIGYDSSGGRYTADHGLMLPVLGERHLWKTEDVISPEDLLGYDHSHSG
ncbi:MAG: dCTP deaminase [Bdellovibrionota bacterium]